MDDGFLWIKMVRKVIMDIDDIEMLLLIYKYNGIILPKFTPEVIHYNG
jgi:hypothetical protein